MRFALGLEYDGSAFCGWQSQANGQAVQDALERALAVIADANIRVQCAGRTDAGVHAAVQVVHFDTDAKRPLTAWVRGVNAHLPDSVAVRWSCEVSPDFHARFSATARHYRYVLLDRDVRPAIGAGRIGWTHWSLDLDAMCDAATRLLGRHDFSCFRAAECQAATPVRDLFRAAVSRRGQFVVFEFSANAFLHHMVRNMVGALVQIGRGGNDPSWITELLEARDRARAAPTFSPDGLYLAGVDYPPGLGLPSEGLIRAEEFGGEWA
ncbi:tRNA pseudouridine(38-40) synthase TruA [Niveibacterium sp. 24ML]|uniref:tRNA pseudouridine(38-40) synthase TruA n=1 Tax=Niveibacterium sp. 24ML TaxID=2985512 RepID=UPI00226FB1F5|nr:tRNA pseudouridine(38-40) synthase TruA [Niveibacterium sp. 24ML]MCX9155135.1 tRNA pseudouridine(38-40) synthase TruA [Niveibacterium sp. 24ML]